MTLRAAVPVFLVLAALFAAVLVRHGEPFGVDRALHAWCVGHRPGAVRDAAVALTSTGVGVVPYAMAAGAGMLVYRRVRGAVGAALFLLGVAVVRRLLADVVARPRPPVADWAVHAGGFAFPSGHTTTAATAAGLLVWAACAKLRGARRTIVIAAAVTWAFAVGVTRIWLGVHWPSDVLGGWLLAAATVGAAAAALRRPGAPR
ncbi:Phosphatidylglycerophosphatase B [Actinomadura rubteroloni]|uniref:Phosphatidylglycerophosphatase B n=1 Tax=Actinomadura rubteroloni TaxID=1926885 RepID=A0A2P4UM51_9ACTN|nr:phosphatase PAP2 family protein [Actinomadura rubteroloni]POM26115.1 Phosphatidylglycerophosphatase B [Actinomadura rubteroloni]